MLIIALIFFVAVGIQICFLIAFLIAFSRKRDVKESTGAISVIVCAHDEEKNLKELIPLLLSQDHPDFEVIIVDDRSNDSTFDYLLEETKNNAKLRMVHVDVIPKNVDGKKFALTLGVKAAHKEWILLTDADCRPSSNNWLHKVSARFDNKSVVLGYSPYLTQPGFLNSFIRFESLLTAIQYIGLALLKFPYMGVGRNLAYKKSFFLDNKGFNNMQFITGGDDDLFINKYATKHNTEVVLGADSIVFSVPKTTLKSFINQKVRHLSVGKYYKLKHKIIIGLFASTWILSWFLGLPLLFIFYPVYWIAGLLILRIILLLLTVHIAGRQLGHKFELWPVVFLDFLYSIYYISTGVISFLTKKVQWRN